MSKFEYYLEAVKPRTQSKILKNEIRESQESLEESRALSSMQDEEYPEGRKIDSIWYMTFSSVVEYLKATGKYSEKRDKVNEWLKQHREVFYYSGEKPEGGNYQFVLDAVYAAQKAGKKYCVGENLS